MNSRANRSELVLAELACRELSTHPAARVLIGGLGMGCTLRAALDHLPQSAMVEVDELNPVVLDWCHGPLKELTDQKIETLNRVIQHGVTLIESYDLNNILSTLLDDTMEILELDKAAIFVKKKVGL